MDFFSECANITLLKGSALSWGRKGFDGGVEAG